MDKYFKDLFFFGKNTERLLSQDFSLSVNRGRHFRKIGSLAARAACECKPIRWLVFEFARERKPDKWLVFEFARKRKPPNWLAFEFARGRGRRASHASETLLRNWGWTHFGGVQRGRLWVSPVQANARPEISLILRQYTEKYFLTTQFSYGKFNHVMKIWFWRRDQSADD